MGLGLIGFRVEDNAGPAEWKTQCETTPTESLKEPSLKELVKGTPIEAP